MLRVFRKILGYRQVTQPVERTEDPSIARRAQLRAALEPTRDLLDRAALIRAGTALTPIFFPYVPSSNPLIKPVREPQTSW